MQMLKNDDVSYGKLRKGYRRHIAIANDFCNDVHVDAFQLQSHKKLKRTLF